MTGGSQQLCKFRIAMRDHGDIRRAAIEAGISLAEARLHAEDDARNPPAEDAYQLIGHNSKGSMMDGGTIAADELRLLIERAERLEEEKKGIAEDIKDVFSEAKSRGYDAKAIRKIIAIRKRKRDDVEAEAAILETYMNALGMQMSFL